MKQECFQCINHHAYRLLDKSHINGSARSVILHNLNNYLNKLENNALTPPEGVQYLNRLVADYIGVPDLYTVEKIYYNRLMLEQYESLKRLIAGANATEKALKLSLVANIIDFGQPDINFDIMQMLGDALEIQPAIDHTEELLKAASKAKIILYLGDNAGEIVADKLLIESLGHPNIYYAVRGNYSLNDSTREDANWVGMQKVARVIDNGHDAPATILEKCSDKFMRIYHKADMIISKGQGNLEGLINETGKHIFFLLMVKCNVIGDILNVRKGDTVVWYNQIVRNERVVFGDVSEQRVMN